MPLKKLTLRPGVNKENTRYTNENGWYDCDKIRFRQGTPEKIGGWQRISTDTFLGVCRSLWNWVTLSALNLIGVGTNLKFYIERGGIYNDITPIRDTVTLSNPFTATNGSATISVSDTSHGCITGDFVTFSGAGITGLGGNITASVLAGQFQITVIDVNTYTFTATATANATDASGSPGGAGPSGWRERRLGPPAEAAAPAASSASAPLSKAAPTFRNRTIDKKQLRNLMAWAYKNHGTAATASMETRAGPE